MTIQVYSGSETALARKIISGRVMELGVPKPKTVRVYSRNSGALLVQTKSDENGVYKAYLPYDTSYLIVAIDDNKIFNAVIQDNVVPK